LVDVGRAFVTEAEATVTVSNLAANDVPDLRARCRTLGWACDAYDRANELWPADETPDPDFAPFRLQIQKPAAPADTLRLLTNHEFSRWLQRGHAALHWQVARLLGTIVTQTRIIQSWGESGPVEVAPATKSPRALVREFGTERHVPDDIRPWLCEPFDAAFFDFDAVQVWASAAAAALVLSCGDEIDSVDGTIRFRGPPRLVLPALPADMVAITKLGFAGFEALQNAVRWVFENEREAEMRHVLFATELARTSASVADTATFLRDNLAAAWESAQIAYQMALADTSRDTLKILADLRKAVTDETARLSDLTRQLMGSLASALALGVGLIAARVAAAAPAWLVAAIMGVVTIYVAMVILSGLQFIGLQRQLRADWQPKLYRFLPTQDYQRMVAIPAARAERAFVVTAVLGFIATIGLAMACLWPLWIPSAATGVASKDTVNQPRPVAGESRGSTDAAGEKKTKTKQAGSK
jgi:hypothetical protein